MGRDYITQCEVILAEEFGEVVEENEEEAQGTAVEITRGRLQVRRFQERRQELEEGEEQPVEGRPTLRGV